MRACLKDIFRDLKLAGLLLLIVFALAFLASMALAYQPGTADLVINAGEDYVLTYFEGPASAPVNQTGTTYVAQCAATPGAAPFANLSTSLLDATTVRIKLSRAQTAKLAGKTGVWWIKRTDASGLVTYRLAGKCTVVPR